MLSTTSKYAIKSLLLLAEEDNSEFVAVNTLADEADVPPAYLSKVIKALGKRGLLVTKKGAKGGVRLKKRSISFYEVCEVLEDPITYENCFLSNRQCQANSPCPFHSKWRKERQKLLRFLKSMKIERSG